MTKLFILATLLCCQETAISATDFNAERAPGLTAEDVADGWLSLFDSESTFGWRKAAEIEWVIEDGALIAKSGAVGLLHTAVQFDDFELRLQYKCDAQTNAGVMIRTSPKPRNPATDCYEINIAPPSNPFPTASIVGHKKSSAVDHKDGWNQLRIVANGPFIQVWCNGTKQLDHRAASGYLSKGYIGLQHNSGEITFKDIRIKPLNLSPLFDGSDLSGWKTDKKMESEFYIDDNKHLRVKNGRGQLESKNSYANFAMSLHVRTNAVGLNSGVFFRCIPGELMNGYESQIQNKIVDSDPRRPEDCGTGGIFRRQNARLVNATDKAWCAKTIVTSGATMCVWVNGYLASDWTDDRKPHANPRKGRRLEAGTFCIQGHDPTTDISFRDIKARELKSRRAK